ncbi:hypothetical protein M3Y95_01119600 [Aphelenchoides besseyi]|nr:hypothetical protein M3Y95_01119600 [Aphelenchoides besseyi]
MSLTSDFPLPHELLSTQRKYPIHEQDLSIVIATNSTIGMIFVQKDILVLYDKQKFNDLEIGQTVKIRYELRSQPWLLDYKTVNMKFECRNGNIFPRLTVTIEKAPENADPFSLCAKHPLFGFILIPKRVDHYTIGDEISIRFLYNDMLLDDFCWFATQWSFDLNDERYECYKRQPLPYLSILDDIVYEVDDEEVVKEQRIKEWKQVNGIKTRSKMVGWIKPDNQRD